MGPVSPHPTPLAASNSSSMSHQRAHASPNQGIAAKGEADPEKALLLPKDEGAKPSEHVHKQYFGVSAVLFAGVCYCMAR